MKIAITYENNRLFIFHQSYKYGLAIIRFTQDFFLKIFCSLLFLFCTEAFGVEAPRKIENNSSNIERTNFNSTQIQTMISLLTDVRLYANNDNLLMRFSNNHQVAFTPKSAHLTKRNFNKQIHTHPKFGHINTISSLRTWQLPNGVHIEFLGSYPIAFVANNNRTTLMYEHGELTELKYSNNDDWALPALDIDLFTRMQTNPLTAKNTECRAEHVSDTCTDAEAPLPVGFNETGGDHKIHINARPVDCHSFFTAYPNIKRGTAIEQALAEHPPYIGSESGGNSFPVADYWNNGNVYVLISRDLTANSYNPIQNPNAFYQQLISDGENIHENLINPLNADGQITHTELAETTTLHQDDAQAVYMDVVVQYGVMTDAQQMMFDQASEELLVRFGITARLIVIP